MNRRSIVLIVFLGSILFNGIFFVTTQIQEETDAGWLFPELGPAVIQDSFHNRAPALESPFGMIGDIPGGYSLYSGNPLQTGVNENLTDWVNGPNQWNISTPQSDLGPLFLCIALAIIPIILIVFLGRKSYGATKTY